jgi:hypothetical protein
MSGARPRVDSTETSVSQLLISRMSGHFTVSQLDSTSSSNGIDAENRKISRNKTQKSERRGESERMEEMYLLHVVKILLRPFAIQAVGTSRFYFLQIMAID